MRYVIQGDVFIIDMSKITPDMEHYQKGNRPAVVVGNDSNNKFCDLVQMIPLTTKKDNLPQHVPVYVKGRLSYAMPEMIVTVHKILLEKWITNLKKDRQYENIKKSMRIQFREEHSGNERKR